MMNTGGRLGGAITAALFLKEFTGGLPWIHLDIAGTAWAEENKPFMPKGPTGVGLRTLVELAFTSHTWSELWHPLTRRLRTCDAGATPARIRERFTTSTKS